jgi:peroxisomal 2,4-dienoyl-CoA reductase
MVYLGANACIVGRNVEKTELMAKEIATARPGSKVVGFGAVDVRSYDSLKDAVDRCVKELGGIDFVMYAKSPSPPPLPFHFFSIIFSI